MNNLNEKLTALGWSAEQIKKMPKGKRIGAGPGHVSLLINGVARTFYAPLTVVRVGDQAAIVRFG